MQAVEIEGPGTTTEAPTIVMLENPDYDKPAEEPAAEEPAEEPAVEEPKQNPPTNNFLVGKVMQKTHGKADPELTLNILKKNLGLK